MAGAFSGHLLNSYMANQPFNSPIVSNGNVTFDPNMHGTPGFGQQSFSFLNSSSFNERLSDATAHKIAALQTKLNQKLGPEYISQRPGPGGGPKLTYAEGWKIINLANEVFGFNGWSSSIVNLTTDFIDYNEESRRYTVGVTAVIRVTLRDGVFHEDIGYGMLENSKSKGAAIDKCKKEAVTDGLKRALRSFGNLLGNCLYDKSYTQEVIKIKVPPPKFDKNDLHRRPEFQETKPDIASTSTSNSNSAGPSKPQPPNFDHSTVTPTRPPQPAKPQTSLPSHMRSEVRASNATASSSSSASVNPTVDKGKAPAHQQQRPPATVTNPAPPQPLNQPLHPLPNQPPHPPQPPEQTVTFKDPLPVQPKPPSAAAMSRPTAPSAPAPAKADDGDESFNFYSDDDAFLAAVDLGDGNLAQPMADMVADMGRPIEEDDLGKPVDEDADMGRPFDDSGGLSANEGSMESIPAQRTMNVAATEDSKEGGKNLASRKSAISAALNDSARPASGMLSRLLPQQQSAANAHAANPGARARPPVPITAQKNQPQRHAPRPQQQQQNQNLDPHPNCDQASSSNGLSRRPSTPSMGGFHFPQGVKNPLQSSSSSGIGTKRPAEAMGSVNTSAPNSNYRRSRPGMGLHQASGGQGRREVLGRLELGDGGDVKRARR